MREYDEHNRFDASDTTPAQLIVTLFDSLRQCIYVLDRAGKFIYVNSAFVRYTETPKHILLQKTIYEIKHTFQPSVSEVVLDTKREVTMFQDIINASKKTFRQLVTATPVFDADGEILYIVVTISSLTDVENQFISARNMEISKPVQNSGTTFDTNEEQSIISASPQMQCILTQARQIADTDAICLLNGESGTGKEVLAKYIHEHSQQTKNVPFVIINCASIPESLMEAELFGYESGAFTGAQKGGKIGSVEAAEGGTLFLDEINSLPLHLQGKLLRVIETRMVKRLGASIEKCIHFRTIAATNEDLYAMVQRKEFRADLFYRLNLIPIFIPPLRERVEDIIPLANLFLQMFCKKYKKNRAFSSFCYQQLLEYHWPGNVRELRNCVERILITTVGDSIEISSLPEQLLQGQNSPVADFVQHAWRNIFINHSSNLMCYNEQNFSLKEYLASIEKDILESMLLTYGNSYKIAKVLKVDQSSVIRRLQKYGLTLPKHK